jgi:WhiB family redox-sensing transcriptional regulator
MSPQPVDDWREHAECKGHPLDWWFPKRGENINPKALAMCKVCPVRRDCTIHAQTQPELFGVWGGIDASARKSSRGMRQREAPTMGDQIVRVLADSGRRMTIRDITDRIDANRDSVGTALRRLRDRGLVEHDVDRQRWFVSQEAVS